MIPAYRVAIAGATVTVIALGWAWWRSEAAASALAAAEAGRTELRNLGAPDPQSVAAAEATAKDQGAALTEAAVVAPPVPDDYLVKDLASAAKRVRDDVEVLRLRAERLGITLPKPLPLEEGLNTDGSIRGVQLGFMHLIRAGVDRSMDAGVKRISKVEMGPAWTDPSGSYACFALDLDLDATPGAVKNLLSDLANPTSGMAVARLQLDAPKPDGLQHLTLRVIRLTLNLAEWKLQPETPPPSAKPGLKPTRGLGARP